MQGSGPAAPPTATATTRKRKIEKEEKDSTGREGRKTRTEQHGAGQPGVPMVFGKQYLRAAEHSPVDGKSADSGTERRGTLCVHP